VVDEEMDLCVIMHKCAKPSRQLMCWSRKRG